MMYGDTESSQPRSKGGEDDATLFTAAMVPTTIRDNDIEMRFDLNIKKNRVL